jgi:hypothetical protein
LAACDVDQHQVGKVLVDQVEKLLGVAGLAEDLHAGAVEQAGQALAEQDVVVGDDHPRLAHRETSRPRLSSLDARSAPRLSASGACDTPHGDEQESMKVGVAGGRGGSCPR